MTETSNFLFFFPQEQNALGSLHNIDFGVFWASWGGSKKKPGSGPEALFRVQKVASPRFRRFRCLMGSEGYTLKV